MWDDQGRDGKKKNPRGGTDQLTQALKLLMMVIIIIIIIIIIISPCKQTMSRPIYCKITKTAPKKYKIFL
jgi:hypothetical protein